MLPQTPDDAVRLTVDERAFIEAFERCTLPEGRFRHRDHIRLAWLYFKLYPVPVAMTQVVEGIKRFAAAHGQHNLYHETITYAFLFLINERMERQGREASWEVFAARNADLLTGGLAFLHTYYRPETLMSDLARKTFVMPEPQIVQPQMDAEDADG